jgi:hypothetical protein
MQSQLLSFQCSLTAPGFIAYQFRLRGNDELCDDGDDAGDDAGDLIVRISLGGDTIWYRYHASRNERARADDDVGGSCALSERFRNGLVLGRLSPHLSGREWTRIGVVPPGDQVLLHHVLCWDEPDDRICIYNITQSQSQRSSAAPCCCCPLPSPPPPLPSPPLSSPLLPSPPLPSPPLPSPSPALRIHVMCSFVPPSHAADTDLLLQVS